MKRKININQPILAATLVVVRLLSSPALAGVPLSWGVDVTRVEPVRLDAYHGETLDLSATLMQGRRQLAVPAGSASFLWQTNGMGVAWWQTNATVSADGVVRGTFGPAMDTGADSVRFFFSVISGSGANYRAAGTIALRASPGATPSTADLAPQTAINFGDYQLVNAPWITASDAAESVRAATNALATVLQASDNALSSAIADAAQAATNYADSVAAAWDPALAAVSNALVSGGAQLVATAATASSNYTDAAVAAIDIPSLTGYATEAWVQGRGYLTEHQSLSGYATEDWTRQAISNALPVVPSFAGYATEAWVQGRGYLTEHQPLAGYATEAWVQSRNYLTEHQSLAGYATETYAQSAASGAQAAAESYARSLAWATSAGSTRLVSLDGSTWQDATGTVWQVSAIYGWAGTVIDLPTTTTRAIRFNPVPGSPNTWTAGGGTNLMWDSMSWILDITNSLTYADIGPTLSATNLTFETTVEKYYLYYSLVALETNPVDRILYASSGASGGVSDRALSVGTPTRWTDATGCVWEVMLNVWVDHAEGNVFRGGTSIFPSEGEGDMRGYLYYDPAAMEYVGGTGGGWYYNGSNSGGTPGAVFAGGPDATSLDNGRFTFGNFTNLVTRVAYTNDIPAETDPSVPEWAKEPSPPSYSAADVGAAPASIVPVLTSVSNDAVTAKLNAETALRIVMGESVWFAVTDYMRTVEGVIPSLQLWEVRDSATNLVYDSREEITNTVRVLTSELRAELEARIPSKAWGYYQSDGTDNPQPGEVAIVNQPTVILTGGGTFNRYLTVGDSSVWVLKASGPVSFGGGTNGNFFAVVDDEGKEHFRVSKTDSYDLPAIVTDFLPRQSANSILLYVAHTNSLGNAVTAPPVLSASDDLRESTWHTEDGGAIDALGLTVSWAKDDTIPAWVATVTPDVWPPRLFLRAKVVQEGGVAVINTAPARFDGGIQIGNGTYRLVPYTTGGKTYLTLEGLQ